VLSDSAFQDSPATLDLSFLVLFKTASETLDFVWADNLVEEHLAQHC
jgi:hypothetical protein